MMPARTVKNLVEAMVYGYADSMGGIGREDKGIKLYWDRRSQRGMMCVVVVVVCKRLDLCELDP
jgi:hypothetical protein